MLLRCLRTEREGLFTAFLVASEKKIRNGRIYSPNCVHELLGRKREVAVFKSVSSVLLSFFRYWIPVICYSILDSGV